MSNMSYCRFHNAVSELLDCEDHLQDKKDSDVEDDYKGSTLSEEESRHKDELLRICRRIAENFPNEEDD